MASPGDEGLPGLPLPPIKTMTPLLPPPSPSSATATSSASASPSPASWAVDSATKQAAAAEEEEDHPEPPSTPTSEGSRLRMPAVCPPAPRKPPAPRLPVKRKPPLPSPARVFVAVPRDLSTVFRALPPKKRIRVS